MAIIDEYVLTLFAGILLGVSFGIIYGIKRIIAVDEKIASMEKNILSLLNHVSEKKTGK